MFAITQREADALSLDAAISSGGPVDFTVGGDLALTATIQSQNDLSFTSSGTMTGTSLWLTTAKWIFRLMWKQQMSISVA